MKLGRYWQRGATVFCTVAAILLFYDTLFGSRTAVLFSGKLFHAVQPILYGAIIAYLLAPLVDYVDRTAFSVRMERAREQGRFCAAGPRAVSILIVWVLVLILCYLLLLFLLPEVYHSVVSLIGNMETYYNTITNWVMNLLDRNPSLESWVMERLNEYYKDLNQLITDQLLPQAQQLMSAVGGGVVAAVVFLKNLLVGTIVSVYLLATKERCGAYCKKLVYGLFQPRQTEWILKAVNRTDRIFSGFVRGKLLDSLIIGMLCFFFSTLFKFPYTPLVSLIIGVTNIIPFFGPFLGAVPCLFLILLDSPIKALYFAIFILALQQLDGNVIGPKILGDRTGLSSLWVIIAILVGGSFFGVPGMFFGVPVLACLSTLGEFLINVRLKRKHLPSAVSSYRAGARPASAAPEDGAPEAPDGEK